MVTFLTSYSGRIVPVGQLADASIWGERSVCVEAMVDAFAFVWSLTFGGRMPPFTMVNTKLIHYT